MKFIFLRQSRDDNAVRTHTSNYKPGPSLIKRGSPKREKQRSFPPSLSLCHSISLPLICCLVSVPVFSINALAGRFACPPQRTDATGHFAWTRHAVRLGKTSEETTAQELDKAPGIVPDRVLICIDKNLAQQRQHERVSGNGSTPGASECEGLITTA
jgi:hypothetical protein